MSAIGYSSSSSTDCLISSIDQNGNIIWTTVIDYNLGTDSASSLVGYQSNLYGGMISYPSYPWIFNLNSTSGSYISSNIFSLFDNGLNNHKSNSGL